MYICTGRDDKNAIVLESILEATSIQDYDWQSFLSVPLTDEQPSGVLSHCTPLQPSLTSVYPDVWNCPSYTHALDGTSSSYSSAQFERFVQLDKLTSDHQYVDSPDSSLATLDSPQTSPQTINIANDMAGSSSATDMTNFPIRFSDCLTMDPEDEIIQHLTLADLLGPPAPQCVPLRTTGVCADMKLRMGVFRLDPFSMHDGLHAATQIPGTISTAALAEHAAMAQKHESLLGDHFICWDGEIAQPLKEKNCLIEFQVSDNVARQSQFVAHVQRIFLRLNLMIPTIWYPTRSSSLSCTNQINSATAPVAV